MQASRLSRRRMPQAAGVAATANGARVMTDHRWRLRYGRDGYFRVQRANGGRVLGVSGASSTRGAQVVLWDDNDTNDHLWRFVQSRGVM